MISSAREDKFYESYSEDTTQKFDRLAQEFDTVRDIENAERNYVNHLVDHPNDGAKWEEFAQFCLRYGLQIKAEQCLYKMIDCNGGYMDHEMRLFLASLMVQRRNFSEARVHLNTILDEDWTNMSANILFGLVYKHEGWPEMSRKHFAIAKVKKMRDLGILVAKSSIPKNYRTESIEFKVEIIDYKKVKTRDEELTSKDCDSLFFDYIDFLLQRTVYNVAGEILEFI